MDDTHNATMRDITAVLGSSLSCIHTNLKYNINYIAIRTQLRDRIGCLKAIIFLLCGLHAQKYNPSSRKYILVHTIFCTMCMVTDCWAIKLKCQAVTLCCVWNDKKQLKYPIIYEIFNGTSRNVSESCHRKTEPKTFAIVVDPSWFVLFIIK